MQTASGELVPAERRVGPERRRLGYVSRQSFFGDVPYSTLEPLLARCEERLLPPGTVLIEPGRENHHLFLVLDGALVVRIESPGAEKGFPIHAGECVGEISIVDGKPTTAYVIADAPCRVLAIPEDVLWQDFFRIPAVARNFMGLYAERFRDRTRVMQQALEQQLRYEHLQRELAIAQEIQAGMLPRGEGLCTRFPMVDIHARMIPASEVGGDFFETFPLDQRRICLAIGDVSGKGIPAALFMVRTMTLLREGMQRGGDLPAVVGELNRVLCRDNERCMFATLLVGVLDVQERRFTYVNAGHLRPLYAPAGGAFEFLPAPGGILVGVNEVARYAVAERTLDPGDVLVLYSDGVTEAMNREQAFFGDERLQALLGRTGIRDAGHAVDTVVHAVEAFSAGCPQSDDLTLLVLRLREG